MQKKTVYLAGKITGDPFYRSKFYEAQKKLEKDMESMSREELEELIGKVQKQMKAAAADLNFEMAAELRDQMIELKKNLEELDR